MDGGNGWLRKHLRYKLLRSANEWSDYSFSFIPTSASSSGKIKLIFPNSGTYIIDALTLENKSTSNLYVSASAGNRCGMGSLASPFQYYSESG